MSRLRVAVLELPATWGEPRVALDALDRALAAGPRADLVVLPEGAVHGYVSPRGDWDPSPFAEERGGESWQAASALARRAATAIAMPMVLREGDTCANAVVAFDAAGAELFLYRKRHPWYPEQWAEPGTTAPPVVMLGGLRVTVLVCFDVQFLGLDPATAAELPVDAALAAALDEADLALFPSAWVDTVVRVSGSLRDSRDDLLPALARRHRVAVANANWGPGAVRASGQGRSRIHAPSGAVLAAAEERGRADAWVEPA